MRNTIQAAGKWWGWALILVLLVGLPAWAAVEEAPTDAKKATKETATEEKATEEEATGEETVAQATDMGDRTVWGDVEVRGTFQVGVRAVDFNGSEAKFKEDIDLDDGVRLMGSSITFLPADRSADRWFDRITIDGDGIGGDPYESWGASAYKNGAYKFDLRTTNTDYFWHWTGEPHSWDLTRSMTRARLSVTPSDRLEIYGSLYRWQQSRLRHTSRDISRNEFEFEEPLDQDATNWTVGARWKYGTTRIFLEQQFRNFNDNGGFRSRGFNPGESPDEAFLTFMEQKEVRAVDAPVTRGGFDTTAADGRVNFAADVLYSDQTLGVVFDRFWTGENFRGEEVTVDANSLGEASRKMVHGNASLRVKVSDKLALRGRYRYRSFDQSASRLFSELELIQTGGFREGADFALTDYKITHNQYMFGFEAAPSREISLYGEIGFTNRDKAFEGEEGPDLLGAGAGANGGELTQFGPPVHEAETDSTAFRVGTTITPDPRFTLRASYDYNDIDNPFTRISPTTANTFKVSATGRPADGWQIGAHFNNRDWKNEITEADFLSRYYGVSVSYAGERAWVSASFGRLEYDSEIPILWRLSFAGPSTATALYESDDSTFSAMAEVQVSEDVPLKLFGSYSLADSGKTFEVRYWDAQFGAKYTFESGLLIGAKGWFVDYEDTSIERTAGVDDFDATIFTAFLGFVF